MRIRSWCSAGLTAAVAAGAALTAVPASAASLWCPAPQGGVVSCDPLTVWYNAARGDYFTTTRWQTGSGGYTAVPATTAWIMSRTQPQPPGSRALWTWYSPARQDNIATTDPAWIPASTADTRTSAGVVYQWPVLEGYVWPAKTADDCNGTGSLHLWWNPGPADNRTEVLRPQDHPSPYQGYSHVTALGWTYVGPC